MIIEGEETQCWSYQEVRQGALGMKPLKLSIIMGELLDDIPAFEASVLE